MLARLCVLAVVAAAVLSPSTGLAQERTPTDLPDLVRRALGEPRTVWPALDDDRCPINASRHVVLMIGDGMGNAQIEAGGHYVHGRAGSLAMEALPYQGTMAVPALDEEAIDSAASATAMATGRMVNNGVVALAEPGDGTPLETVAELFGRCGRQTGLVTTSTMAHATPAAFAAHHGDRNQYNDIIADYLRSETVSFILGGRTDPITVELVEEHGWTGVTTLAALEDAADAERVLGFFSDGHLPYRAEQPDFEPQLAQLTEWALARADAEPSGSFLLIEGARIDHAGHDNLDRELVEEMAGFDEAVDLVVSWASERDDVLVFITADHETGGLEVVAGTGAGNVPELRWEHGHHTAQNVRWYAMGPGAERIPSHIRHTDVYRVLLGAF